MLQSQPLRPENALWAEGGLAAELGAPGAGDTPQGNAGREPGHPQLLLKGLTPSLHTLPLDFPALSPLGSGSGPDGGAPHGAGGGIRAGGGQEQPLYSGGPEGGALCSLLGGEGRAFLFRAPCLPQPLPCGREEGRRSRKPVVYVGYSVTRVI